MRKRQEINLDFGKVDRRFEIEDVVRGPPPPECHYPVLKRVRVALMLTYRTLKYGCPLMWTVDCARCPKRPVKSHKIEGISIHDAIARGLVTKEQAMDILRKMEAEQKNGDNQG